MYFFEVVGSEPARLFLIVLGTAAVDGTDVGHVLIFGEGESDFKEESIDLGVELYSEESHELEVILFIIRRCIDLLSDL